MNIIKLKDILMPDFYPVAKLFNTRLKGKYAYWVKMRYIFPLDSIDYDTYIKYEQMDNAEFSGLADIVPHIDLYATYYSQCMIEFVQDYIDATETDRINDIYHYEVSNRYSADYDIDVEDLKNFRSWLAGELLKLNTDANGNSSGMYSHEIIHMLEYYKNNRYNDIIKYLNAFGGSSVALIGNNTTCGCCTPASINVMSAINNCDTVAIYRNNIKEYMIVLFSDVEFWKSKNKSFLTLFKRYIDNILRLGFTLPNASETSFTIDCQCTNGNDNILKKILENLSLALQYIIDDNMIGHKNFIYDALYDWSKNAYEYMSWK
jgi:hypothetical protein